MINREKNNIKIKKTPASATATRIPARRRNGARLRQSLSEVVLSWSVDQILDKDLLRDKVRSPLLAYTRSASLGRPIGAGRLACVRSG